MGYPPARVNKNTWTALENVLRKTREIGKEFFLAGGITPENVYEILNRIQPDGIDVGSGIEETEGKKSHKRMELLFEEINRYRN